MYDNGNYIQIPPNPSSPANRIVYKENCEAGVTNGQEYRMAMNNSGFSLTMFSPFRKHSLLIDGNLGADGRGSVHNGSYVYNRWTAFWKVVYGTTDPGIHHLFITDGAATHEFSQNTNSDIDRLHNVNESDVFYIMWGTYLQGNTSFKSSDDLIRQLVRTVVDEFGR